MPILYLRMGMGFAPTWLRQVSPPPASQNHFNHCPKPQPLALTLTMNSSLTRMVHGGPSLRRAVTHSHTLYMQTFYHSLAVLTAIFQVNLGQLVLLKLRVMEVVVTTGAIRRAKLQTNHHQQTNTQCSTGRMPFLSPTSSVKVSY